MEILLIIVAFLLAITGIVGAIYPIIPGVIVSYGSLLAFYFGTSGKLSITELVIWGIVLAIISVIDAIIAPLITNRMGGSKRATRGSLIGVIVGSFFFPPIGMIFGAFFGALLGEMSERKGLDGESIRIALGSLLGFLLGTGVKLIVSVMILIQLILKVL